MTHVELVAKLQEIRPGSEWSIHDKGRDAAGNKIPMAYEDIEWLGDPATKPTAQDLGL